MDCSAVRRDLHDLAPSRCVTWGVAVAVALLGCSNKAATNPPAKGSSAPASSGSGSWIKRLGDTNPQVITAVATDSAGNVFATGYGCGDAAGQTYRNGSIDFGAGPRELIGECGLFVVKYAPDGALAWVHSEGQDGLRSEANAIAVLTSGAVLIVGHLGPEMLLEELASDGKVLASFRFRDPTGTDGSAAAHGVAVTTDGDWIVVGETWRRIDLGTGLLEHPGTVSFVARYSPQGKARWVRYASAPTKFHAQANAVVLAPSGDMYACGATDGAANGAGGGGFLQALNAATGDVRWTKIEAGDCDALVAFGAGTIANGVGGAPLVSRDASGNVLWQLPTDTEPFAAQALALRDSELVAAGQLGTHQLQLLRLDVHTGRVLASNKFAADLVVHGIAAGSSGLTLGGSTEGRVDLGIGPPIQPEPVAAERMTNSDAVLARLTAR